MEEVIVNKTNTELEKEVKLDPALELLREVIKTASAEINLVLVKHKLEIAVAHKLVVNPDLKQEEIAHEIVLRPAKQ